MPCSLWI